MKTDLNQQQFEKMRNNPENYKWGFFYFNSTDTRFIVPKRIGIGWTLNFANPYSYLVLAGIIAFAIIMGNIG